jgi:plastocyanin
MNWKRMASGALVLATLVGGLSACGDDSGDDAAKTADDAGSSGGAVDLTVKASSSAGTFAFDMPAEIDGGLVNLTLDNVDNQPHELAMVKVADGTTPDQVSGWLAADGAPIPDFIQLKAAGVGNAAPGQKATSTQDLEPGSYVYFCTFGDGDQVHYKNGMLGAVTIQGSKGTGDLPKTDNTIVAEDWTFSNVNLTAADGPVKVDFKNIGPGQIHHAQLMPLKEGATIDQALQELAAQDGSGPDAIDFEKGTGTMVLGPGQEQVTDLTLQKGSYVIICFLTDKAGGPPHFLPAEQGGHGMVKEITVS